MRISDNHSCAIHGAPGIEWLKGSTRGTAPCAIIHSPVARCDHVSPSPSTLGEKAVTANRAIATSARTRPDARASQVSELAERAVDTASDMSGKRAAAAIRRG